MPKDNIECAIKRGLGELDGGEVEEMLYEGYGPGGVAVLCEIMTDNRNRTAPEIRKIFETHGGKLGATNCVGWMFERKGVIVIPANKVKEDRLMEVALEGGADDVKREGDSFEVLTTPDMFVTVSEAIAAAGIEIDAKDITRIPSNTVEVEDADVAAMVLKLVELLDDHDDVQSVSSNFNIPDAVMSQVSGK